ncbi:hypothetical protein H1R20_g7499, partial [Candolleomyces eurysporus]
MRHSQNQHQHPQWQQYPQEGQYPHDQHQQAYPHSTPNSYTEYPPPSSATDGSPPPSPYRGQDQAYAASSRASYSRSDSLTSNRVPRFQRQESYYFTPPQSPGFPQEQHEDVNEEGSLPQSTGEFRRGSATGSRSDREVGVLAEEASLPSHHAPALLVAGAAELPPSVINEPQHQEHDAITSRPVPAPAVTSRGSPHLHLAEPSTRSSEKGKDKEKEKEKEKSKKRGSWMSAFFKGMSKHSNSESGESTEGASQDEKESKRKSKRSSISRFGKK